MILINNHLGLAFGTISVLIRKMHKNQTNKHLIVWIKISKRLIVRRSTVNKTKTHSKLWGNNHHRGKAQKIKQIINYQ